MVLKIIDIKILKNGRIGGYIIENNVKKFRFLSNKDVEKIIMKGGYSNSDIKRKLKRLLKNKIISYWKAPFGNKQHRERRKEYKSLLKNLESGAKNNRNTINSFKELMSKHGTKNKKRKKKINNLNYQLSRKLNEKLTKQSKCQLHWEQIVSQIVDNQTRKDIIIGYAHGAFGSIAIFKFKNSKYVIKRNKMITNQKQREQIIESIKDEFLINKKLYDKCQKLLTENKLINLNYNFINEPICLTNEYDIILSYGGTAVKNIVINNDVNNNDVNNNDVNNNDVKNNVNNNDVKKKKKNNFNNNDVNNLKNLLLNFVLLELEFRPIIFCTDLKPDNIVKDEKGLIRFIDFGDFCNFNRIISNYSNRDYIGKYIKKDNYLDSDDCFYNELKDKLINFNKKYSKKNYLDLFLTIYAISYIIFIYQSIEFFSDSQNYGNNVNILTKKNHINLLFKNYILYKCFQSEKNKEGIKIFFYPTNKTGSPYFGEHTIKGLQAKRHGNRAKENEISEDLDNLFKLFTV